MKKIACILVLVIALAACHKQEVIHYTINSNLLAHYNFQKGSYWVYKDSLTGNEDSFFVVEYSSTSQVTVDDYSEKKISDQIDIRFRHTCTHALYVSDTMPMEIFLSQRFMNVTIMGNDVALDDPFTAGTDPVKSFYANYSVGGISFSNVYEINEIPYPKSADSGKYNDWYYLSDSAGLVKIVLNHPLADTLDKVWKLERWKVIK